MASQIRTFTKKGSAGAGVGRSRVPVASLGKFDASTGKVYQYPRIRKDGGIGGSGVTVTNPAASEAAVSRRTASLGMGGVGQRGRGQDF